MASVKIINTKIIFSKNWKKKKFGHESMRAINKLQQVISINIPDLIFNIISYYYKFFVFLINQSPSLRNSIEKL